MTNLLTGVFIFFLGLAVKIFKASYLIAGYNTASKEEKAKYDQEKLINYVSGLLMISSLFLILGAAVSILLTEFQEGIIMASWIMFTIFILASLVYVNTGNRLMKTR